MENKNELLGVIVCFCCGENEANIYRNKRKNRYFYARCPSCGCLQPTGEKAQALMAKYVPVGTALAVKPLPVEPVPAVEPVEVLEPVAADDGQLQVKEKREAIPVGKIAVVAVLGIFGIFSLSK